MRQRYAIVSTFAAVVRRYQLSTGVAAAALAALALIGWADGAEPAWLRAAAAAVTICFAGLFGAALQFRRSAPYDHEFRALQENLARLASAAARADEANRLKSHFFAQVAHELRTPLNAILGFSDAMRHEMFGPHGAARYGEYAQHIHDAGAHLLSLINDLLDHAKLEAGKIEISPIRVSAPTLAQSAMKLVELAARERAITLTASGVETCPDLLVDPRAAKQVLLNLLANAINFTPPGGHVGLHFAGRAEGGVEVAISDTGIGMSAQEMHVAFEPFGRAAEWREGYGPGTGLGLPLARGLVRLHGGELSLASRPGGGTVATAVFPAEPDDRRAEPLHLGIPRPNAEAA